MSLPTKVRPGLAAPPLAAAAAGRGWLGAATPDSPLPLAGLEERRGKKEGKESGKKKERSWVSKGRGRGGFLGLQSWLFLFSLGKKR